MLCRAGASKPKHVPCNPRNAAYCKHKMKRATLLELRGSNVAWLTKVTPAREQPLLTDRA